MLAKGTECTVQESKGNAQDRAGDEIRSEGPPAIS